MTKKRTEKERLQLSENIKYLRKAYKLTQKELCKELNFSLTQGNLSSMEAGLRRVPDELLNELMILFNLTKDDLLKKNLKEETLKD